MERFRVHLVEESGRVKPLTWHRTYRSHLGAEAGGVGAPESPARWPWGTESLGDDLSDATGWERKMGSPGEFCPLPHLCA